MLVIGLTGGIGSGKSTVADLFAALGAPVIDTDQISREIVEPGSEALRAIVRRFGAELLLPDGSLDRQALRTRIFSDPEQRTCLEQLLHPRIREEVRRRLADLDALYAIVVVPLLFESGFDQLVDRVLVVDAPKELQIARVTRRDASSRKQVADVLAAQMPRDERVRRADDLIINDADLEALRTAVTTLDAKYRTIVDRGPSEDGRGA